MNEQVDTVQHIPMYTPTPNGGHARYSYELLTALAELGAQRGITVSLITSVNLDPAFHTSAYPIHAILPPLALRDQFRTKAHWVASRLFFYWQRDRRFVHWVEQDGAAAVHLQEYSPWLAPLHIRRLRRRGIKVFATVHNVRWNSYPELRLLPKWLPNRLNRVSWQLCDALFVHSESLKHQLAAFLGPDHPPIYVTPHGTWQSSAFQAADLSADARRERRQLLCFGIISPYKGLHILLEALAQLPDVKLVIAGEPDDDAYIAHLRTMAAQLPAGQVQLLDRFIAEDEIAPLFAASSLVVLPYTSFAAQSGVLHDALAYSVPVVSTEVGALGESTRAWNIGQVVPPADADALAAGIRTMLEPERYRSAVAAITEARSTTSWRQTAARVVDAYQAVLDDHR